MPRPSLLKRIARLSSSPSLARAIASSNSPMEIDSVVEEHDTTPHMQRKEKKYMDERIPYVIRTRTKNYYNVL